MVRRDAAEFPDLPAEIAAAARAAANAQKTVALALAPSISDAEFEAYRQRILASVDNESAADGLPNPSTAPVAGSASLVERMTVLADRAEQDCVRAIQRTTATTNLLERALFVALNEPPRSQAGASSWRPSYSLVRGGK